MPFPSDTDPDTEVFRRSSTRELERQTTGLQLIASENFTSPAVMRAVGSVLTNKYSEGYPGKRYYGGNAVIDEVEALAIERAKALFGAEHANVQPHSGANANMCVYQALLSRATPCSGSASTTAATSPTARRSTPAACSTTSSRTTSTPSDERIDMDQVRDLALEHRPKMIVAGTTSYPRRLDPEPFRGDRRRGRRAVHVRRRPHRRADRRRRPPEPGAVRRHRHVHHAQDAARPAWRLHPVEGRARQGDRQGGVPRLAGRPARARHRRQGGRLPRGDAPAVRGLRPPDRRQRVGPRRGARRTRASASCRAAPTTT